MRKYGIVLALVVVSFAAWVASASAVSSPQVFNLLAVSKSNLPPINGFVFDRAPRPGDQFAIGDTLYKWAGAKKGALAGHDQGTATFQTIGKTSQTTLFTVQVFLSGGTMFVEGMARTINGPSNLTLPILGGTGKYAGANGYVNVRPLAGNYGNNSNLEFHLLR